MTTYRHLISLLGMCMYYVPHRAIVVPTGTWPCLLAISHSVLTQIEDDAYQEDLGFTTGQLGRGGVAGPVRGPAVDKKTQVSISKRLQVKQNLIYSSYCVLCDIKFPAEADTTCTSVWWEVFCTRCNIWYCIKCSIYSTPGNVLHIIERCATYKLGLYIQCHDIVLYHFITQGLEIVNPMAAEKKIQEVK